MRPTELNKFAKRWNEGATVAQLSYEFQMTECAVRSLAPRNRELCGYRTKKRALTPEQIERVRRARKSGARACDLAKMYGVHHSTIRRYCNEYEGEQEEAQDKSVYDLLMDFAYSVDYMGNCPSEMIEDMAITLAKKMELK